MSEQFGDFLASLSEFLIFFVVAAVLILIFVVIYTRVTRHNELALIKKNSTAAAIAFSGSLIGFALPLASTMISSVTIVELVLWGVVALIVQVLVYLLIRLPMPRISERIEADEVAAGIWLGACSIVAGIINAASMTT
jgi:putative membrane protein